MTTSEIAPDIVPPVDPAAPRKYGSFSNRMIASSIDIGLLFLFALPAIDFMMAHIFTPPDMDRYMEIMRPALNKSTGEILAAFWQATKEQQLIQRLVVQYIFQIGFLALYILPSWFRYSSTPGKMLFRLVIVDEKTGAAMSDEQAVRRFLGYILSALPVSLGFMWIMCNKKRRGFHDMLAGTVVIVKPKAKKADSV